MLMPFLVIALSANAATKEENACNGTIDSVLYGASDANAKSVEALTKIKQLNLVSDIRKMEAKEGACKTIEWLRDNGIDL